MYFQATLHQFLYGLNSCSPDTLLKVGAAYPEMAVQEKAVDMFVELLRKDQVRLLWCSGNDRFDKCKISDYRVSTIRAVGGLFLFLSLLASDGTKPRTL